MPEATFHFPRGFLWGTATSSHQVEGNNKNNNWWAWEQEDGRIAKGHKSGLACDWWGGRWREDFDRAAEGGQNAHRLSIEWSRVQPAPDRWDEDALEHYRQMMRGLLERGLQPVVTLHHFTDPLWLAEMGGWEFEGVADLFEEYTRRVVGALKEYVNIWCTLNEPNALTAASYVMGWFPPGKRDINLAYVAMSNMVRAHAAAYYAIHALQPEARVGIVVNCRGFDPAHAWFPLDRFSARLLSSLYNDFFPRALSEGVLRFITHRDKLPRARGTQDFLGVNYYTNETAAFSLFNPGQLFTRRFFRRGEDLSPSGEIANQPQGMFEVLMWAKGFGVPLIVTENGTDDEGDEFRRRYLAQHVHKLWHAVNFNYPIQGYFHWSLVDNFEWHDGWTRRFGLWELDVETQGRRKRPSADFYGAICKENGLSSEMVARYAPEVFEVMFPG